MIKLYKDFTKYTLVQELENEYGEGFTLVSFWHNTVADIVKEIVSSNFLFQPKMVFENGDTYEEDYFWVLIKEYDYSNLKVFIEQEFPEYVI